MARCWLVDVGLGAHRMIAMGTADATEVHLNHWRNIGSAFVQAYAIADRDGLSQGACFRTKQKRR